MREQVWFIVSKTNERRYATTRPPAGEWVESLKKEGYSVYRIEFEMPGYWDPTITSGGILSGQLKAQGYYVPHPIEQFADCGRCSRPFIEHVDFRCPSGVIPGFDE